MERFPLAGGKNVIDVQSLELAHDGIQALRPRAFSLEIAGIVATAATQIAPTERRDDGVHGVLPFTPARPERKKSASLDVLVTTDVWIQVLRRPTRTSKSRVSRFSRL